MFIAGLGAICFGLTVGWMAYQVLRNRSGASWLSDLIALLGVIAGAGVLAIFRNEAIFGWYAIGLIIGFFAYLAVGVIQQGRQRVQLWQAKRPAPPTEA
ncbi:MAG TPA: hypothetical protein VFA10_05520 [Ktedonobacteraceae bacterium]|nr:hypothetical protein [Ktedonobacteraceae bacterium]